jgi:hypothetical protein
VDVIKDVIAVPSAVVDDFVVLVELSTMPHSHIRNVAYILDVGNPPLK